MRLTAAATNDFEHIIDWTIEHPGESQALAYSETLSLAIEALADGPSVAGAKQRHEILKGLYSLHVARQGQKGSHFVMFRIAATGDAIEVLRLLHDAMDLPRHLAPERWSSGHPFFAPSARTMRRTDSSRFEHLNHATCLRLKKSRTRDVASWR